MSTPKIVLHGAPQTRAGRIVWLLEELGVPHEKVLVDLSKGDQKTPAHLAINPNGKVPAMTVDGTPMFESLAIFLYLADRFGVEKKLWPRVDEPARCEALSWCVWESVTLGGDAMRWMMAHSERAPKELHHEPTAKAAKSDVDRDLDLLEARLTKSEWLLGDRFTLADGWIGFATVFFSRVGVDLSRLPKVKAWGEKVQARPAFQKAMQPW